MMIEGPGRKSDIDNGQRLTYPQKFNKLDLQYADMSYSDYKTGKNGYVPPYKNMVDNSIRPMLDHYAGSVGLFCIPNENDVVCTIL